MNWPLLLLMICWFWLGFAANDTLRAFVHWRLRRRREQEGREILEECEQLIGLMQSGQPMYGTIIERIETPDGAMTVTRPIKLQAEPDDDEETYPTEDADD